MKHFYGILIGLACLVAPWVSSGSNFQQQQTTLYPYQSSIQLQEEFTSGGTTNSNIGALGWGMNGGTTSIQNSSTGRMGIIRRDTGAVANTVAALYLNPTTTQAYDPANAHSYTMIIRYNSTDANTEGRIGSLNGVTVIAPTDGIYFERLTADTNWFCVTRSGGVQTRNDSGVAMSTNFTTFSYTRNTSGVIFRLNNSTVCPTHTTNIPTVFLGPGMQVTTLAAASKTADIDYAELNYFGLVR